MKPRPTAAFRVSSWVIGHWSFRGNGGSSFRGGGGFTLIEVLTSILIIAIVLPIIMTGVSLSTSTAGLARHRTQAATLGQSKLNELLASGEWQNNPSGVFGEQWPEYGWTSETVTSQVPVVGTLSDSLVEFHLNITWQQRGQAQQVTLSTLLKTPSITAGGTTP